MIKKIFNTFCRGNVKNQYNDHKLLQNRHRHHLRKFNFKKFSDGNPNDDGEAKESIQFSIWLKQSLHIFIFSPTFVVFSTNHMKFCRFVVFKIRLVSSSADDAKKDVRAQLVDERNHILRRRERRRN